MRADELGHLKNSQIKDIKNMSQSRQRVQNLAKTIQSNMKSIHINDLW